MFEKVFICLEILINSNYKANGLISEKKNHCMRCLNISFSYLRQMIKNQIKFLYLDIFTSVFLFLWKTATNFSFMTFNLKFPVSTVLYIRMVLQVLLFPQVTEAVCSFVYFALLSWWVFPKYGFHACSTNMPACQKRQNNSCMAAVGGFQNCANNV